MQMSDEPVNISQAILEKISEIEDLKLRYREASRSFSQIAVDYDKVLALTMVKLRNGVEIEFEGQIVKSPQATLIERVSRGICWQEKLNLETISSRLDAIKACLNACQAQLNALQSINRHLGEI